LRLLFDENLSPDLVRLSAAPFPGSVHLREAGLLGATDGRIWEFAKSHGFAIVSKDDDFHQRSFLEGPPPKVIWLRVGNAGTREIAELLQREAPRIREFASEPESALLIVGPGLRSS